MGWPSIFSFCSPPTLNPKLNLLVQIFLALKKGGG